MNAAHFSAASQRNREPVLGVLRTTFASSRRVLEIGSGCGYHAIGFAAAMPWLVWQPSETGGQLPALKANLAAEGVDNVLPPVALDTLEARPEGMSYDALYSANTAHIMTMEAVRGMFRYAGDALETGGLFACYGPFRRGGRYNSAGNADFDRALRTRDPESGLRDLETLDQLAASASLERLHVHAMPSNNLIVTWVKTT